MLVVFWFVLISLFFSFKVVFVFLLGHFVVCLFLLNYETDMFSFDSETFKTNSVRSVHCF